MRRHPPLRGAGPMAAAAAALRAPLAPADAGDAAASLAHAASFAPQRIELLLQQLDSLPTLGAVAMRLLQVTSDETSSAQDVIALVASDLTLSAKVVRLCRTSGQARALDVTTVDRAVKLLGFQAVRSAALSVQVFEVLDGIESPAGERAADGAAVPGFNRTMFWHHSLAVACVCEALAGSPGACQGVPKPEAFISGLLHDLGMLALHVLLPRTFDRVCQLADANAWTIDHACRRVIGIDTHTVGRRLAEHWRLPHSLGDVVWLHGQRLESLPNLPHRAQIALVTLADQVARSQGIAPPGHGPRGEDYRALAQQLGIDSRRIDEVLIALPREIADRAACLGLDQALDERALLRSISRANEALGRINEGMRPLTTLAQRQTQTLRAIAEFHESAAPGGGVVHAMGAVVRSASRLLGGDFFVMIYQRGQTVARAGGQPSEDNEGHSGIKDEDRGYETPPEQNDAAATAAAPWEVVQFSADGRPLRVEMFEPPEGCPSVAELVHRSPSSFEVMRLLPWLNVDEVERAGRRMQLLPLRCGWGVNAALLHDGDLDDRQDLDQLEALSRTWAAAIAASAQHEGAKRLGEQLAESNRALVETQDALARRQALASLGEITAGAAHEMNNPLTVISGRSQILAAALTDMHQRRMAQQIVEQSHVLSDLITALREYSAPGAPNPAPVDLNALLATAVEEARSAHASRRRGGESGDASSPAQNRRTEQTASLPAIQVVVEPGLPLAWLDAEQMGRAIRELVRNALESESCTHVEVRAQIDPVNDRLRVQVVDDGSGLSHHALAHAFDPFFSAKPAGRQPGLGLSQARRIVEAHGGQITLENAPNGGAVAIIRLPEWRVPIAERRDAA